VTQRQSVTQIWSAIGISLFALTVDVLLRTAGVKSTLSAMVVSSDFVGSYSVAIFGILFGAPMLMGLIYVTRYYLSKWPATNWCERLPIAFNLNLRKTDELGSKVQLVFLIVFLIVPMIGQARFFLRMIEGTVYLQSKPFTLGRLDHFVKFVPPGEALWNSEYIHGPNPDGTGWVTYFPFYEPWILLIAEAVLLIYFCGLMKDLFEK